MIEVWFNSRDIFSVNNLVEKELFAMGDVGERQFACN